jgi:hypothetical protein
MTKSLSRPAQASTGEMLTQAGKNFAVLSDWLKGTKKMNSSSKGEPTIRPLELSRTIQNAKVRKIGKWPKFRENRWQKHKTMQETQKWAKQRLRQVGNEGLTRFVTPWPPLTPRAKKENQDKKQTKLGVGRHLWQKEGN